jgi:MFS family permease
MSERQSDKSVKPPDGGFGWIVVLGSFFVHVFVVGNSFSFGVFYPVYIKEFNASQGNVAWIGSIGSGLMTGFTNILYNFELFDFLFIFPGLGAISGALSDKYGNRKVLLLGTLFISIGYALASFSTELWHLFLTQGVLAGIGYR